MTAGEKVAKLVSGFQFNEKQTPCVCACACLFIVSVSGTLSLLPAPRVAHLLWLQSSKCRTMECKNE